MKGIVFTEFLEMVEQKFGFETSDAIVEGANLPHGGVYTSVGSYPHSEMVDLLVELNKQTQIEVSELLKIYGEHLLGRFAAMFPQFFEGMNHVFDFLDSIENTIHVEVKKLYSDAHLPNFETVVKTEKEMGLVYCSESHLEDLAEGLIIGSIKHFGRAGEVSRSELEDGRVRFDIRMVG